MRFQCFGLILITILLSHIHAQDVKENTLEGDKERMDIITACWMLSIQDQAMNAIQLEKVLAISKDSVKLLDKIQVEMVRRCFRHMPVKEAEKVIDALTDPKIVPVAYRTIVTDLGYEDFTNTEFSLEFDQFDQFLKTLIVELEKNMGKLFKVNRAPSEIKIFNMSSKFLLLPLIFGLIAIGFFIQNKSTQTVKLSSRRDRKLKN